MLKLSGYILLLISLHMFVAKSDILAKMSSSMLDSILLINLSDLGAMTDPPSQSKRRAAAVNPNDNELAQDPPSSSESYSFSSFEASHEPPLETNSDLTLALKDAFSLDGDIPSYEDFKESIVNLASKKDGFGLSNGSFLSATKSLILSFYEAGGEFNIDSSLPLALYEAILPYSNNWDGTVSYWVKHLSKVSMEAILESGLGIAELSSMSSSFASTTVRLITEKNIQDINLDYLKENDDLVLEDRINLGQNYSPSKTALLQQLGVGLSQGYFGYIDFKDGLSKDDFYNFANPDSSPNSSNNGQVEMNIVTGFFDGLMNEAVELGESKEVFIYDAIKASANGFLISATVASTSKAEYLDQLLYLDAAEMISKQIAQSVILHSTESEAGPNPVVSYSVAQDWIEADRIAESVASGAAMGSQLGTVLPKAWDYSDSWEIATNIRRDIAKSVSLGSSSGAINSASWLGSISSAEDEGKTVFSNTDIEKIARGSSLGSMIGNTGLAIYYPTDQLLPIINKTAQGSAYGSLSSKNLATVKSTTQESIDIGVARQSALGSAMGAIFEPTVLLQLSPDLDSNERNTIDHLTAASFGATFGAILGLQESKVEISSSNLTSQLEDTRIVEVQQATKQGAIEGALTGAKLSLGLDEVNTQTLKSKTALLKAINAANTKAASNSSSKVASQSLRTNSRDMLLLMKKFGINPRYTNPAKMYKRPVIVQVDEPPIDDESSEAINNASPL
jgi:hypothetical protein